MRTRGSPEREMRDWEDPAPAYRWILFCSDLPTNGAQPYKSSQPRAEWCGRKVNLRLACWAASRADLAVFLPGKRSSSRPVHRNSGVAAVGGEGIFTTFRIAVSDENTWAPIGGADPHGRPRRPRVPTRYIIMSPGPPGGGGGGGSFSSGISAMLASVVTISPATEAAS